VSAAAEAEPPEGLGAGRDHLGADEDRLGADEERDPELRAGRTDPEVSREFPELRLLDCELDVRPARRSPAAVKHRLRLLSNRFHGAQAVNLRRDPVPAAYRIFFRHIGLDPDTTPTPLEAAVLERMLRGGFQSRNLVDDALLVALVETGVPVWALDARTVHEDLRIRLARADERLGLEPEARRLPGGTLVVADAASAVAVLFGELAPGRGVTPSTRRTTLFALQVAGVPAIHVEEALWTCASVLRVA
jgi:DNA/RNA-binding domain of Phe-tRNA-synthetase-like protein